MKKRSLLVVLSLFLIHAVYASPPWTYTNTGINHVIIVDTSIHPTINGAPVTAGDFIGVFYDSSGTLACGGYEMWTGTGAITVAAFGNDLTLPSKDGFTAGELFKWKIWRHSDGVIVTGQATYRPVGGIISDTGTYLTNGLSSLGSLNGFTQYAIVSSAGANGSITPSGTVSVNYGSNQQYSLTPATGYHVDSLLVDDVKVDSTTIYTFRSVTAAHTIRAVFKINSYAITAIAGSNGSIVPSGTVNVNYGSNQAFTITPGTGYHVDSLLVDGVKVDSTTSYTFKNVTAGHTIRAVFRINRYTITAIAGSNGSIAPAGTVYVSYGANQAFAITPATGYHVDSLFVDGVKIDSTLSYTFTNIIASHSIRAVFKINSFTITAAAGSNGSIAPSGTVNVNYGSNQQFTMTPAAGFHIDSVLVDGLKVDSTTSYTFKSITAGHTIRAVFRINSYAITATTGSNGSIAPSGTINVNYGSNQQFTMTPATGYHVDSVLVDGLKVDSTTSYTFTNIITGHTIRAVFRINGYSILASAGPNGSIAPSGTVNVNYGSNQQFTISPATGYHIDSVLVDGTPVDSTTRYTFTNVVVGHTIRAVFRINSYTITATAGVNGTISPSGTVSVDYGSNQQFMITPTTGYHVDSLMVDGVKVDPTTSYTFKNIGSGHAIRAVFRINSYFIVSTAGAHGSIAPSGTINVNYGTSQQYIMTPATGYHVDSVIVDGLKVDSTISYAFTNVTMSHSIRATFRLNGLTNVPWFYTNTGVNHTIIIDTSVHPTVDGLPLDIGDYIGVFYDSAGMAACGGYVMWTGTGAISIAAFGNDLALPVKDGFTAGENFQWKVWRHNNGTVAAARAVFRPTGGIITDLGSYVTNGLSSLQSLTGSSQYIITAHAQQGGSISPSGGVAVGYGADQAFAITPVPGNTIDSVVVDGINQGAITAYVFTNVMANHIITAYFSGTGISTTLQIAGGWNMLSLPEVVKDSHVLTLFPSAISHAFVYSGSYVRADSLVPGVGYWLKFGQAGQYPLAGVLIDRDSVDVRLGWNMIGSMSFPVAVAGITSDPPGITTSNFFGYNGRYVRSDTIVPGSGYWVKVNQSGKIILSVSPVLSKAALLKIDDGGELPPASPDQMMALPENRPTDFTLGQNYPNPANPLTVIRFGVPKEAYVRLTVYNMLGERIAALVDEVKHGGYYQSIFDGTGLASGVYFYTITAGEFVQTRKLILIK